MTSPSQPKILVLGASGMMGNTILRALALDKRYDVIGTVRSKEALLRLPPSIRDKIATPVKAADLAGLEAFLREKSPACVINCVGVVKQLPEANDPLTILPLNSLLPHQLARLCGSVGVRLIHLSSDCVFDGSGSMYTETDFASADDLYGRSKYLGEVDYPNAVTLRTSTIGHELGHAHGLLEWFLAQTGEVPGFAHAMYSGVTTVEFARIIGDLVLPNAQLAGVYHVSGDPISKYHLLTLIRDVYGKDISIRREETVAIDRTLDSSRFRDATGYQPPSWQAQIEEMRRFG